MKCGGMREDKGRTNPAETASRVTWIYSEKIPHQDCLWNLESDHTEPHERVEECHQDEPRGS